LALGAFQRGVPRGNTIESVAVVETNIPIELIHVLPGQFVMGSPNGLPLEVPAHCVSVLREFAMGAFPITQAQWQAVMGNNPSEFTGSEDLPVENVSWDDAKLFCAKLSEVCGHSVRLPTEAEWEYACRAGTTTEFFWGSDEAEADKFAWFDLNSVDRTHPVRLKRPNPLGVLRYRGKRLGMVRGPLA
jgi:formylglycine-generating enzyme required for sulfatase activity